MNYTERYELHQGVPGNGWTCLGVFDTETEAVAGLERRSAGTQPGRWRVVRISSVTVATVSRA